MIRRRKHDETKVQKTHQEDVNAEEREVPLQSWGSVIILVLFIIRAFNSFTICTYFQPDEYYQALEIAHHYVFGSGYVTWEWKEHLRSSIHPLIYALGYKVAAMLGPRFVVLAPKVIGAIIATLGDYGIYTFAQTYTQNERVARAALVLWVLNPFNWYVLTRAFSNSFETVLTILGFVWWPWREFSMQRYVVALIFGLVSCVVRPTNAIMWGYLGAHLLVRSRKRAVVFGVTAATALVVLAASTVVDYLFYGELTFPLYNFLEFNVVRNLSVFYGSAPWHFYIFQAIPLMMMLYLPFLGHALISEWRDPLVHAALVVLFGFSIIRHKEFRFIFPIQPIMVVQCARSVAWCWRRWSARSFFSAAGLIVTFHCAVALLFTRINERGVVHVIQILAGDPSVTSVGFLAPCHSTPWQSHIHDAPLDSWWFLTCEPPLHVPLLGYKDESDQFYENPAQYFVAHFPAFGSDAGPGQKPWPSHLVAFEPLKATLDEYLQHSPYRMCNRLFNSYFHWDPRRRGDLIVYCQT